MGNIFENLEVLRRIAERGQNLAYKYQDWEFVDTFQHLLNEIQVTKRNYEQNVSSSSD